MAAKRGAGRQVTVDLDRLFGSNPDEDFFAVGDSLDRLAAVEPRGAKLVSLRSFGGRTRREAAADLCIAPRTADFCLAYARAWLAAGVPHG
jgi:hypothetical protein